MKQRPWMLVVILLQVGCFYWDDQTDTYLCSQHSDCEKKIGPDSVIPFMKRDGKPANVCNPETGRCDVECERAQQGNPWSSPDCANKGDGSLGCFVMESGRLACLSGGDGTHKVHCEGERDCARGHVCISNTCRRTCPSCPSLANGCAIGEICTQFNPALSCNSGEPHDGYCL